MSVGIVLIHGYSGAPEDLSPLADALAAADRQHAVTRVCFPGHGSGDVALFDKQAFVACISEAVYNHRNRGRKVVIVGHSTGGVLALCFLAEYKFAPELLILAAVPRHIDIRYLERWRKHRTDQREIPLSSVAHMVSLINTTGAVHFNKAFPVSILHAENDDLVLSEEALAWRDKTFSGPVRAVTVPGAPHHIFSGTNRSLAIDVVLRSVADIDFHLSKSDTAIIEKLSALEPESDAFLETSALSGRHLSRSPGGQRLLGNSPSLFSRARNEPILANIEITARCNSSCQYCARSFMVKSDLDMHQEQFRHILDMLPHAYRVTLVGLGEPLLHPNVVEFVAEASTRKRRVGLVTNAMRLERRLSSELIDAGLDSIAFSIDAADQDVTGRVRAGTDVHTIVENIAEFVQLSSSKANISTAVFTAVSINTVSGLKQLIDMVSHLGVSVLMLTDLNFKENLSATLWKNADATIYALIREAVKHAFSKKLPVLSVHALEEFGLRQRYRDFLLLPPDQLAQRSLKQTWCYSPWQTIPVDVRGNATICDCQPREIAGNIFKQSFSEIWNGAAMTEYRRRMLASHPPQACKICPRF